MFDFGASEGQNELVEANKQVHRVKKDLIAALVHIRRLETENRQLRELLKLEKKDVH